MSNQIIAVINQKGGVGKTTTTVNLAAYLAKIGKKILIVDFDPQGNVTSGIGIAKDKLELTVYDVLLDPSKLSQSTKTTSIKNMSILPATPALAAVEVELVDMANRESKLKAALHSAQYDYILIDCPPSLGLLSINALVAANSVLIPVQAEYYALEGLSQLLSVIQRVREGFNPGIELLGVVLTMYDKRNALAEQVRQELEKHFSDKLFSTVIPRNVRLAEAPGFGKTILEHDKWSKGARAYKQLSNEVIKRAKN